MQAPATGGVRFAPSPTGQLHVGNLRTAWISWQIAQDFQLPWVVRFEDIDQARVLAGAKEKQLSDLKALGLFPDIELLQTNFRARHWQLFKQAVLEKKIYPCDCSRKEVQQALATMVSAPHSPVPIYSGRCRTHQENSPEISKDLAWRFKMPDPSGKDDFIVSRTGTTLDPNGLPSENSFVPSYHWACAIDDFDGKYDMLVRSSDLRSSLLPQRSIHEWLGIKKLIPVFHTSLVMQNDGYRLEKRTAGVTLNELSLSGVSPEDLVIFFKKSFREKLKQFHVESIFGETPEALTLSQLGLRLSSA